MDRRADQGSVSLFPPNPQTALAGLVAPAAAPHPVSAVTASTARRSGCTGGRPGGESMTLTVASLRLRIVLCSIVRNGTLSRGMRKLQVLLLSLILLTVSGFAKGRSSAPRRCTSKSRVTTTSRASKSTGTTTPKSSRDVTVHGYTKKNGETDPVV